MTKTSYSGVPLFKTILSGLKRGTVRCEVIIYIEIVIHVNDSFTKDHIMKEKLQKTCS